MLEFFLYSIEEVVIRFKERRILEGIYQVRFEIVLFDQVQEGLEVTRKDWIIVVFEMFCGVDGNRYYYGIKRLSKRGYIYILRVGELKVDVIYCYGKWRFFVNFQV